MENKELEYAVEQMRLERHDFMNYIQVVLGYIQINRPKNAIEYISKINARMSNLSKIYNLECPYFAILMQDFISQCNKINIDVDFDTELEYISSGIFSKNIEKEKNTFYTIKGLIDKELSEIGEEQKKLYIYLSGKPDDVKLIFSNIENKGNNNVFSHEKYKNILNNDDEYYRVDVYRENNYITIVYQSSIK